jgi:hypothetical protein
MQSLYVRPHRSSIHEPATINDIPQEVLEKFLILILPSNNDLQSASMACRAWRPVAQKLIHSRVKIDNLDVDSMVCGYWLNSLVFGSSSFQISTLFLDLAKIGKEFLPLIAQIVGPTLSSLYLDFYDNDLDCYEIIEIFFSQCQWIRYLRLEEFMFKDNPFSISSTIMDGFNRLNQLYLIHCYGNLRLFIEITPISNLESLRFRSVETTSDEDIDIVDAAVMNCGRSLVNLNLDYCFVSPANLVKIAECCRGLEKLSFSYVEDGKLSLSDMKIIASFPHLKFLEMGKNCEIDDEAVSFTTRCRGLNHLGTRWRDDLIDVLCVIGRNLVSLDLWEMSVEEIDAIVEHCPNLQYLEIKVATWNNKVRETVEQKLRVGLKRLAKLKVDYVSIRLGTDWLGY